MNLTFEIAQFAGVGAGLLGVWGVVQLIRWFQAQQKRQHAPVADWLQGMDTLLSPTEGLSEVPHRGQCDPTCTLHTGNTWNKFDD